MGDSSDSEYAFLSQLNRSDLFKEGVKFADLGDNFIRLSYTKLDKCQTQIQKLRHCIFKDRNQVVLEGASPVEALNRLREMVCDLKEMSDQLLDVCYTVSNLEIREYNVYERLDCETEKSSSSASDASSTEAVAKALHVHRRDPNYVSDSDPDEVLDEAATLSFTGGQQLELNSSCELNTPETDTSRSTT